MPVLPEYRLDGKVAFVAGDADGITPAIAIALAESGAKVFIMAPGAPTVETSMLSVAAIGGEALGQFGDPADPERIARLSRSRPAQRSAGVPHRRPPPDRAPGRAPDRS